MEAEPQTVTENETTLKPVRKRSEKQIAHSKWLGQNSNRLKKEKREREMKSVEQIESRQQVESRPIVEVEEKNTNSFYLLGGIALLVVGCGLYCTRNKFAAITQKNSEVITSPKEPSPSPQPNKKVLTEMEG